MPAGACSNVFVPGDPVKGRMRLWVYPDPIDNPLGLGQEITDTVSGVTDEDGDGLAITSIDALNWTENDYDFEALIGGAEMVLNNEIGQPPTMDFTLRRMTGDSSANTTTAATDFHNVSFSAGNAFLHLNHIRGLAFTTADSAYLRWGENDNEWELWRYNHPTSTRTQILEFTNENVDRAVSPYHVTVGPAHFPHGNDEAEIRESYTFLNDGGRVIGRLADSSSSVDLANGAPDAVNEAWAPYFDTAYLDANFGAADDNREFYFGNAYGQANATQRYRHPMDTTKGVFRT